MKSVWDRLQFARTMSKVLYRSAIVAIVTIFAIDGNPVRVAQAASFIVDSTVDAVDANPGDGVCATAGGECTLRAAIQETNALDGADTINLPAGTYTLSIPGVDENASTTGDLDIARDLVISGAGATSTIVDGGGLDRVFEIFPGSGREVEINGMTIQNGDTSSAANKRGGGIALNSGTLTLRKVIVRDNKAGGNGGGIDNGSTLLMSESTVSNNSASFNGGGFYNINVSTMMLTDVMISGNSARSGGGISNISGEISLTNTLISGNTASFSEGGGIDQTNGMATLTNVTVSGNTNDGILVVAVAGDVAALTLINSTITINTDNGITAFGFGTLNSALKNSIVANHLGGDCTGSGALTSEGNNLYSDDTCSAFADPTDLVNTDPLLGPLADNGGPTQTHALLSGSPAIDTGDDTGCPATDQRGMPRPVDGDGDDIATCDIGAYEYGSSLYAIYLPIVIR